MMKNAFYFILRALFVLEIVLTFFYLEKRLDKKAMINFNFKKIFFFEHAENERPIFAF